MTDHRSFFLDESLHDYVIAHTTPADPIRQSLTEATAAFGPWARMQVADAQAALLSALVSRLVLFHHSCCPVPEPKRR